TAADSPGARTGRSVRAGPASAGGAPLERGPGCGTPFLRPASEDRDLVAPQALQDARPGHGTFATSAVHAEGTIGERGGPLLEVPELDVARPPDVASDVL